MARFRAFAAVDMLEERSSIGEIAYADRELLVVESRWSDTYYFGRFSYPGDVWRGTIETVKVYDRWDLLHFEIRDLDISTRYAWLDAPLGVDRKTAFRGDDRVTGSRQDDRLAGFDGDDLIVAGRGDDRALGQDGADWLEGRAGDDDLRGGRGADVLIGGAGDDRLRGERGPDTFIFAGRDGSDRIVDYVDGRDLIAITGGADRFRDLEIFDFRGHALVYFADTEILLRDVDADRLDPTDFVFT